jgi:hypothetical protein
MNVLFFLFKSRQFGAREEPTTAPCGWPVQRSRSAFSRSAALQESNGSGGLAAAAVKNARPEL